MSVENIKSFCKDNSHTIFTVFAVIFSAGAVIEAVHATTKACKKIEDAEYDNWEELGSPEDETVDISLTAGDTIKLVWTDYIPTFLLLGGAIGCEIMALRAGQKKIEGLAGAYVVASQTINAIKDGIKDHVSQKDVNKIESTVLHKTIEKDKENEAVRQRINYLRSIGETTTIYRDAYSPTGCGVYLKGTMEQFRKAVNLYNKYLSGCAKDGTVATLNDWYDCLSRVGIDIGRSDLGDVLTFDWEKDGPMELYSVCDSMDPDMDDNPIIAIGLRRPYTANNYLAFPSSPYAPNSVKGEYR